MNNNHSSSSDSHSSSHIVKPSKPSIFTGSKIGTAAFLWLEELKNYFNAAGIVGNHRTVFAVAHLKEEALLWKTSKSELVNPQNVEFDIFCQLFLHRFQPIGGNLAAREELRRLKYNGNIQQYVSSFQSLMQRITDMSDTDKLDYFTSGLNRSLKTELIKQGITDLQQAINIAVRIASIDSHITTYYNNVNSTSSNSSSSTSSNDSMQIDTIVNNIESEAKSIDSDNSGSEVNAIYNNNSRFDNRNWFDNNTGRNSRFDNTGQNNSGFNNKINNSVKCCLLYTSPSPRD